MRFFPFDMSICSLHCFPLQKAPAEDNQPGYHREIVENMSAAVVLVKFKPDGSTAVAVNCQLEEMTGFSASELSTLDDIFRNLFGDREQDVRDAYSTDRTTGFSQQRHIICNRKDGEQRCLEFSGAVFPGGEVWLLKDVTETMSVQENSRALIELSSDGYLLFDEGGVFDCNAAAVRCIGAKGKSELIGRHPAEFSPEFQEDGRLSMEKAVENTRLAQERGFYRCSGVQKHKQPMLPPF